MTTTSPPTLPAYPTAHGYVESSPYRTTGYILELAEVGR